MEPFSLFDACGTFLSIKSKMSGLFERLVRITRYVHVVTDLGPSIKMMITYFYFK